MITKKRLPRWIGGGMLAVMILTLTACSGAPKWVKQGSNFNDKAFYGVGAVNGVKNEPLAWEAAKIAPGQRSPEILKPIPLI